MGRRIQRLIAELAKFLAVGGAATIVALVIFNGLVHGYFGHRGGPMYDLPLVAYVIANLVGMAVSYRGSRSWAFREREVVGSAGGRTRFVVINLLTMLIPMACLAVSRYVLHRSDPLADNLAANVIGLGLGTGTRFLLFREFIFVHPIKAERLRANRGANRDVHSAA
ncbi:MAG: GtrA family protein [Nocardioidaceae bacterium]